MYLESQMYRLHYYDSGQSTHSKLSHYVNHQETGKKDNSNRDILQ